MIILTKKEYNKRLEKERNRIYKEYSHREEMHDVWCSINELRGRLYKVENTINDKLDKK